MQLTVYSAFWCPECREAKRFLQSHNIAFQDIDIETTPGAADEVIKQTRAGLFGQIGPGAISDNRFAFIVCPLDI